MNVRWLLTAAIWTAGTALTASAQAQIVVEAAWVRATPGQSRVSAGYAHIANSGTKGDRLTSVTMPDADSVEVHHTTHEGGVMSMERVEALEVPAGATVDLNPGGYHFMIMGLTRPLQVGQTVQLSFHFAQAGDIVVPAKVAPLAAVKAP